MARNFPPEMVGVGAALHSVRGVPDTDLEMVAGQLPVDMPLHIHLSEQPAENEACLAAYGVTLRACWSATAVVPPALGRPRHAHDAEDIELLGAQAPPW